MAEELANRKAATPWRPIALGDYRVPSLAAKEGLFEALRRLQLPGQPSADLELVDPESVPSDLVAHLVPELDLEAAASELDDELQAWLEPGPQNTRSVVVVGPPGSGVGDVVATWSAGAEVTVLEAPTSADLDEGRWEPALPDDRDSPLILPPLERLFVRRVGGLDGLRGLLRRLQAERRPYACASSSWAWSFLERTLPARLGFDRVLAPAPLDGAGLRDWLKAQEPEVELVESGEGEALLGGDDDVHDFLRALAARSRGVVGVAVAVWQHSLCAARIGARAGGVRRCVLPAWKDVSTPELPRRAGKDAALLLHALLVHGSLEQHRLSEVLPLPLAEAQGLLWELHGGGLVTVHDDAWQVSLLGYPAVRSHLASLSFPLDGF